MTWLLHNPLLVTVTGISHLGREIMPAATSLHHQLLTVSTPEFNLQVYDKQEISN